MSTPLYHRATAALLLLLLAGCPSPASTSGPPETTRSVAGASPVPRRPLVPSDAAVVLAGKPKPSPPTSTKNLGHLEGRAGIPSQEDIEAEGKALEVERPEGLLGTGLPTLVGAGQKPLRLVGPQGDLMELPSTGPSGDFETLKLGPTRSPVLRLEAALGTFHLLALIPPPRAAGALTVRLDPASTMIAEKLQSLDPKLTGIPGTLPGQLAERLAASMSTRSAVAAIALVPARVVILFDQMLSDSPELATDLGALAADAGMPGLLGRTASPRPVDAPSPTATRLLN